MSLWASIGWLLVLMATLCWEIAFCGSTKHVFVPSDSKAHDSSKKQDRSSSLRSVPPQHASRCHKDCTTYGTCNEELGRCDCPPFRSGEDCSQLATPACQLTADYLLPCTYVSPGITTCACFEQCFHVFKTTVDGTWSGVCVDSNHSALFLEAPQTLPQAKMDRMHRGGEWKMQLVALPEGHVSRVTIRPLGECPKRCSNHGWCVPGRGGVSQRCHCFYGYTGDDCLMPETSPFCPSACSGHGTCQQGFCHCKPGFYGFDCSLVWNQQLNRSQLFWQQHYRRDVGVMRPAIYVYDLPSQHFSWQIARYMGLKADFGRQIGLAAPPCPTPALPQPTLNGCTSESVPDASTHKRKWSMEALRGSCWLVDTANCAAGRILRL
ncbi:hypothetical protein CYMTET_4632 [Cymbomonas tetramitiformis]|uniref:EGF-like domain-containing protein n=1 Tax=Cymbomonas tetramitiformis TaxID=36881 RepID=A0AAE0H113_9CHLO|nr:hypothetical protein CYMTET_4632 [Cymbomonas tetramitiformis]